MRTGCAAARADAERLVRDARLTAAAALLLMDDPPAAARVLADAVAADPLDEAAHRLLMTSYSAMGEPSKALAVYERLRGALAADLGVDPAPETRAVHVAVLRERPPTVDVPRIGLAVLLCRRGFRCPDATSRWLGWARRGRRRLPANLRCC